MRFHLALWSAKTVNWLVKKIAPGRGSNIAGAVALKIDPNFVSKFKFDPDKILYVTGTNGKSSTTNLIVHLAQNAGLKIISNIEGANMLPGVANSLLRDCSLTGKLEADFLVMETDERSLPLIHNALPTNNLLVTNLQKDQVGRNGDPAFIYRKIKQVVTPNTTLFLNNEEPRSASLQFLPHRQQYFFSVEKNARSFNKDPQLPTMPCPLTHSEIEFSYMNVDNVGPFSNRDGSYKSKSESEVDDRISSINFDNRTFNYEGLEFHIPYNVSPMLYNYVAALSIAKHLFKIDLKVCQAAFLAFQNIDGRFVEFSYRHKKIRYLRIKQENPDTLQNVLNVIADENEEASLVLHKLQTVVDFNPFYLNNFFCFDCDIERLKTGKLQRIVDAGSSHQADSINSIILWLKAVDWPADKMASAKTTSSKDLLDLISQQPGDVVYLITYLGEYEAMRDLIEKEETYA